MIWLRKALLVFVIFFGLLALTATIAVSGLGSATLVRFAVDKIPSLEVDKIEGGLSSTLELQGIKFHAQGLKVDSSSLSLTLKWRCFLQFAVCADQLSIAGLTIDIRDTQSEPESLSEQEHSLLRLPMLIAVEQLSLRDTRLTQAGAQHLTIDTLNTQLRAYQRIRLINTDISSMQVHLPRDKEPPTDTPELSAIALPDIFVPIALDLENLALRNVTLIQSEQHKQNFAIASTAFVSGTSIVIDSLRVEHELGKLEAKGALNTKLGYPLDLDLSIDGKLGAANPIQTSLELGGSLTELTLNAAVTQPIEASLDAQLQPLSAERFLDAELNWQSFEFATFIDSESLSDSKVAAGQLNISGDWQDYQVALNTQISTPQLPTATTVDLSASVNALYTNIEKLTLSILDGEIVSHGQLLHDDVFSWHINTQIQDIRPGLLNEDLPSKLSAELEYDGQWFADALNVNVPTLSIEAIQQGEPLEVSGSAAFAGHAGVAVSTLKVSHRDNSIQGFIRILTERRVDADLIVAISEFANTVPNLSGSMRGNILVFGDIQNPSVDGQFNISQLAVANAATRTLIAETAAIKLSGDSATPTLMAKVENPFSSVDISVAIDRQTEHWSLEPQQWEMRYKNTGFSLSSYESIALTPAELQLQIAELCWQSLQNSEICLEDLNYLNQIVSGEGRVSNLSIADLEPLLEDRLGLTSPDGQINMRVSGQFDPENGLQVHASANIGSSLWVARNIEKPYEWQLDELTADVVYQQQSAQFNLAVSSEAFGNAVVKGQLDKLVNFENNPIEAEITLDQFNLAPLALMSTDVNELRGQASADLSISGNLQQLLLHGDFKLNSEIVDIEHAPAVITNWYADVQFEGQSARFDSTYTLGKGDGMAKGRLQWQPDLNLAFEVKGENLTAEHNNIALQLSPDLNVVFRDNNLSVDGSITVPKGLVKIDSLPQSAVTTSNDVHLRGEPPPTSLVNPPHLDVLLSIDPEQLGAVQIDAFGLESNLSGQLQIKNQPSLSGFGTLSIGDGEYRAYGQELLIRTGEIQFNGPLSQPLLYVEAIRDPDLTEDNVVAGIRIDGIANQPNIEIFSEPGLDQAQALSYLLSGRGEISAGDSGNTNYAGLLFGLGVSSSETLTNNVGKALGIEQLRLQTKGSGDDTQITVSGKLSDDLTLEYGVGVANSASEVRLRYQLQPKLYLEAISGYYNSLLLYYRFSRGSVTPTAAQNEQVQEANAIE